MDKLSSGVDSAARGSPDPDLFCFLRSEQGVAKDPTNLFCDWFLRSRRQAAETSIWGLVGTAQRAVCRVRSAEPWLLAFAIACLATTCLVALASKLLHKHLARLQISRAGAEGVNG